MSKTMVYGIDVGNRNTRIVQLQNGKKPRVLRMDSFLTPEGTVSADGTIVNPGPVADNLRLFFSNAKMKPADVAFCMNTSQAVIREFSVPVMADKEIRAAVEFQLSQRFPGIVNTHGLSLKILSRKDTGIQGVVAFCPNKAIQTATDLVSAAGLSLRYLDLHANAICKANRVYANGVWKEQSYIYLDYGYLSSQLVLVHRGQAILNRFVESGSDAIDKLIAGNFNVTNQEAEDIKLNRHPTLALDQREKDSFLRLGLISIEEQLRHLFEFFSYGKYAGAIVGIVLGGGASVQDGIKEHLQEVFQTQVIHTIGAVGSKEHDKYYYQFVPAIGVALREEL